MKKTKLEYAVAYKEYKLQKLNFPIYIPYAPMLGKTIKESKVFFNVLNGQYYISLDLAYGMDLPEGFSTTTSVEALKERYKTNGIFEAVRKMFLEMEKLVYFFNDNTGELLVMSDSEFEKTYGIKLDIVYSDEINLLTEALIDERISAADYYKALYEIGDSNTQEETKTSEDIPQISIKDLVDKIKQCVISQDEAIKSLVVALYKPRVFNDLSMKSNILMYGPTGVGKTELIRRISKEFDAIVTVEDMTRFTDVGYVGSSADDVLVDIYKNAGGDLEKAETSILFLDEIDKKATKETDRAAFNKGDVLNSLLKVIEGGVFEIEVGRDEVVSFDTSRLTVIVGGAFSELYESKKIIKKNPIGFESEIVEECKTPNKKIGIDDFKKYGVPVEFLSRFKTIIRLNALGVEDFVKILKTSELSSLKNYIRVLESKGINLVIPDSTYEAIAKLAYSYDTGARALNIVVDSIFEDILYDLFENMENVSEIVLGENILTSKYDFKLVRKMKSI